MSELRVSAHLMTLDPGTFCVVRQPGTTPENLDTGLPGVRVSLPPGRLSNPDAISISTFRPDGWLGGGNDAALIRIAGRPAQIMVTVYQAAGQGPDSAPRLQVVRISGDGGSTAAAIGGPATGMPAPAGTAAAAGSAPDPAKHDVVAHVQRTGDVGCRFGEWLGVRGSQLWIEGFGLAQVTDIAPEDLEYQAVLGRGWLSPWVASGKFCGSRGMALPLLGVRIRLLNAAARTHTLSYSASFTDGTLVGPVDSGEACEAESLAPLEAVQITIRSKDEEEDSPADAKRAATKPVPAPSRPASRCSMGPCGPVAVAVRFLFIHQNFPGQFLHLVRHLVAQKKHEIVFITEPNQNVINGVKKVPYRKPEPGGEATHWTIRELDLAVRRAEIVAATAANLRALGFVPDIVIGHHGWGELLNLRDVWPDVPILGYFEFFYRTQDSDVGFDPEFPVAVADYPRIRAKNCVNLLALALGAGGQTPTVWQHSTYPEWARKHITVLPEGVDLSLCKPDRDIRKQPLQIGDWVIKPSEKLVTYVARDLEPYRGCHIVLRALPRLLAARTYVRMLQRSNAHVYFTYPFVASWSLREALATGAPVIGSDTTPVREFIRHEQTGLLTPFFEPDTLADNVLRLLEDTALAKKLGDGARKWAEANLAMPDYLDNYNRLIETTIGTAPSPPPAKRPFDGKASTPTSVKPRMARKAETNAPGRSKKTAGTRSRP
jgi:glycosyltransferase involved in cell wall biosynthesis